MVGPHGGALPNVPIGRMSPLTAAAFLVAAIALGLCLPPWGRRRRGRQVAALLALAILLVAGTVSLSYLLGAPLFYGSQTIPMAMPTAFAFALASLALLAMAGRDILPLSLFATASGDPLLSLSGRYSKGVALAFLCLLFGIGAAGRVYVTQQLAESRDAAAAPSSDCQSESEPDRELARGTLERRPEHHAGSLSGRTRAGVRG